MLLTDFVGSNHGRKPLSASAATLNRYGDTDRKLDYFGPARSSRCQATRRGRESALEVIEECEDAPL